MICATAIQAVSRDDLAGGGERCLFRLSISNTWKRAASGSKWPFLRARYLRVYVWRSSGCFISRAPSRYYCARWGLRGTRSRLSPVSSRSWGIGVLTLWGDFSGLGGACLVGFACAISLLLYLELIKTSGLISVWPVCAGGRFVNRYRFTFGGKSGCDRAGMWPKCGMALSVTFRPRKRVCIFLVNQGNTRLTPRARLPKHGRIALAIGQGDGSERL